MGRCFTITNGVRVKKDGSYSWPCKGEPNRTIELFTDDVLTKDPAAGTYMAHTGIGCFGIVLTDEEVEPIGKSVDLRLQ